MRFAPKHPGRNQQQQTGQRPGARPRRPTHRFRSDRLRHLFLLPAAVGHGQCHGIVSGPAKTVLDQHTVGAGAISEGPGIGTDAGLIAGAAGVELTGQAVAGGRQPRMGRVVGGDAGVGPFAGA